jgi:Serine hydrolase (FSH1)
MDDEGAGEDSMLNRIRDLPVGQEPEDVMRNLVSTDKVWKNRNAVIQYLYDILETHSDIEGIIGYSEGSAMAATLILDEVSRLEKEGRPRRIKCAVFFTGWPPLSGKNKVLLADESDTVVDIPTLHVIGANGQFFMPVFWL